MGMLRQVVLVREDLGFPRGLLAAQVAHLHMEYFRDLLLKVHSIYPEASSFNATTVEWLRHPYTFVHGVPNAEVLQHFMNKATAAGVSFVEWKDTVYINISETQREAFPAVCIGIAFIPTESDTIKTIIGDLPLLK